jgi:hypothetical protein
MILVVMLNGREKESATQGIQVIKVSKDIKVYQDIRDIKVLQEMSQQVNKDFRELKETWDHHQVDSQVLQEWVVIKGLKQYHQQELKEHKVLREKLEIVQ